MRNPSIDVLRALAVLLVLGRHADFPTGGALSAAWRRGGWIGVDVFFVLSGFLVSGLLFRELAATGHIDWRRFFIRRGFKIYPAFYTLLAFTLLFNGLSGAAPFDWRQVASEACFLQNYGRAAWGHTWSLAVEEHFYFLLPGLLLLCQRRTLRLLPPFVLLFAVLMLAARVATASLPFDPRTHLFPTHLRLDSLLFGVLLSYYYHHDRERMLGVCRRHRAALWSVGLLLLAPPFVWPLETTPLIYTVGLTGLYLGSGAVLAALVGTPWPRWLLRDTLAWIGSYSYSIYLWHAAVLEWLYPAPSYVACYLLASLVIGILLSKLIEMPMLRLRDAWFADRALLPSKLRAKYST